MDDYLGSYIFPLIEEIRADLCSALEAICQAPFIKIESVEEIVSDKQLGFRIVVTDGNGSYEPKQSDIFVLSETRPKHISDLTRNGTPYIIASVVKSGDDENHFVIRTSQKDKVKKIQWNAEAWIFTFCSIFTKYDDI